jgi:hypothetical protein
MLKPMTAAEYAAHSEKVKAQESPKTEIVTLKSGSVMELQRIDLQGMVKLGILPQALVGECLKALRGRGAYTPQETPELRIESLIMQREVVRACCVMPPFNEQTAQSFLPKDFDEIYEWAMSHQGVEGAEALTKSRKGRRRGAAGNGADGAELQPATVSTATN